MVDFDYTDLNSHYAAWRAGLVIMVGTADSDSSKSYWQHELKAYERTIIPAYKRLKELEYIVKSARELLNGAIFSAPDNIAVTGFIQPVMDEIKEYEKNYGTL